MKMLADPGLKNPGEKHVVRRRRNIGMPGVRWASLAGWTVNEAAGFADFTAAEQKHFPVLILSHIRLLEDRRGMTGGF